MSNEGIEERHIEPFDEKTLRAKLPPWIAAYVWSNWADCEIDGWVFSEGETFLKEWDVWIGGRDTPAHIWFTGSRFWVSVDEHSIDLSPVRELPDDQGIWPAEIWCIEYEDTTRVSENDEDEETEYITIIHVHQDIVWEGEAGK